MRLSTLRNPDHPRVGGEHSFARQSRFIHPGSSPRGRGTPANDPLSISSGRIIPAWAGNTDAPPTGKSEMPDHPRVGGEHTISRKSIFSLSGSSPRGRGTHQLHDRQGVQLRIIPAWAGNTPGRQSLQAWTPDHPRVGGEHGFVFRYYLNKFGSSPRGRGTHGIC